MRRFNLVFLAILLVVVAALGGSMHLVHSFQMQRNASALLDRAKHAEASKDLATTEQSLNQYLNLRPEDGPTWEWYARVVDTRNSDRKSRQRVFLVQEQALRHNPGNAKLLRRCADLAMELGRHNDAQRHFAILLEQLPKDSRDRPAAVRRSELEDLLGQCARGLSRFEEAETWFLRALKNDPRRLACYDRLARLRRSDLRRNDPADGTIKELVSKNPTAGRAYLYRWRYCHEFSPPAATKDIQEALKLAPNDPEVLLTAAVASEEKADTVAARTYFEKGRNLDPKNLALVVGLARLETKERHLERAEDVLRQGFQANPSVTLAFVLTETLILQDKIEGKDQAEEYIARLRKLGLGDTMVRFLEAEVLVRRKKWAKAIPKIEMARAVLNPDSQLVVQLELMLAECYGQVGYDEQRLDALRRAAENVRGMESVRVEFAQALTRSGKFDQAVAILAPLASRKPEWRLDLIRLLTQRAIRQPREKQSWQEVEQQLREAEKALPQGSEPLVLVRLDVLAAQNRLEDARSLLASVTAKEPRNLHYRLALARLIQRQGNSPLALQILDQTEKDIGPSIDLQLARLDYWGQQRGDQAKRALASLAENRQQVPSASRPTFLDRLGSAEIQLGELNLARQYWNELAALEPENIRVRLGLFELAVVAGDQRDAVDLVARIRNAEGEEGVTWRYAQAALLIDKVRRGAPKKLDEARRLASEIAERRPQWAGGFALNGELAELGGSSDQAIGHYRRAVELGSVQSSVVRRLVALLNQQNRYDEIDQVAQVLRDQGANLDEVTIVEALDSIRNHDYDRGIALARRVFPDTSTNYSDHVTLGRLYMSAGRSDEAGKEFQRAVGLGPGVPESWLTYVQYLVQTNQINQANAVLEDARRALPADRSMVTLAECSLMVRDLGKAEALIQTVLKEKPRDPTALRVAADVYLVQNRLDKVNEYLNELDRVASASPGDRAWAKRTRITVLLSTGRRADRDRALGLAEQNLRENHSSAEDRALKATVLAARHDRRVDAIKILEQLAAAKRLEPNERFLLAQLYLVQHDERKYRSEMVTLLSLKLRQPRLLAHFINFLVDHNQLDEAEQQFALLRKLEPDGRSALELEARILDRRNRKPDLRALLVGRGRVAPDQIGLVADLLDVYGFANEAEEAYNSFIARDPTQPERRLALIQFLGRRGRVTAAIEILKKAWTTCRPEAAAEAALTLYDAPSVDETQRRELEVLIADAVRQRSGAVPLAAKLGVIWIRQGRFDDAMGLFRRLLTSDPDNADALNSLAWLLALQEPNKTRDALALIEHAIEVQGPIPVLLDTRAVVLIRAGQSGKAVQELRDVQVREPGNASAAAHLGWAYQKNGQMDEAKRALQKAGELGWKLADADPLERAIMEKLQQDLGLARY